VGFSFPNVLLPAIYSKRRSSTSIEMKNSCYKKRDCMRAKEKSAIESHKFKGCNLQFGGYMQTYFGVFFAFSKNGCV